MPLGSEESSLLQHFKRPQAIWRINFSKEGRNRIPAEVEGATPENKGWTPCPANTKPCTKVPTRWQGAAGAGRPQQLSRVPGPAGLRGGVPSSPPRSRAVNHQSAPTLPVCPPGAEGGTAHLGSKELLRHPAWMGRDTYAALGPVARGEAPHHHYVYLTKQI